MRSNDEGNQVRKPLAAPTRSDQRSCRSGGPMVVVIKKKKVATRDNATAGRKA